MTALDLRTFMEGRAFCALTLSPLIAAIADASEGLQPTSVDDATCARHFGCGLAGLPTTARRTVAVRAGGRGGKTSRLLAPKALHAAWTVALPTLRSGEVASSLLVAPDLKLARQALSFVAGYVAESSTLRRALVGTTKDSLTLRRPDGKLVRVEVLAATRGGRAVRGRTLVFAGLDEACFFYDEASGGVVNDADVYRAVAQRVVPTGQVWIVSTPWLAKTGLLETIVERDLGKHTHALCATAPTRALNPTWDPDGSIERDLRAQDPDAARREIDGEPLSGGAVSFFDGASVDAAVDRSMVLPLVPQPGMETTAGGDFAFRSDSSALVVVHRDASRFHVAELMEIRPQPGEPLKPSAVVASFAACLVRHGLSYLVADGHYREAIVEHLNGHDLSFKPAPTGAGGVAETYQKARLLFREGRVRIPDHPQLLRQLRAVEWRPNAGGTVTIVLPRDRTGGHCDLASALVLALWEAGGMPVPTPAPKPNTPEYWRQQEEAAIATAERALAERLAPTSWSEREDWGVTPGSYGDN